MFSKLADFFKRLMLVSLSNINLQHRKTLINWRVWGSIYWQILTQAFVRPRGVPETTHCPRNVHSFCDKKREVFLLLLWVGFTTIVFIALYFFLRRAKPTIALFTNNKKGTVPVCALWVISYHMLDTFLAIVISLQFVYHGVSKCIIVVVIVIKIRTNLMQWLKCYGLNQLQKLLNNNGTHNLWPPCDHRIPHNLYHVVMIITYQCRK